MRGGAGPGGGGGRSELPLGLGVGCLSALGVLLLRRLSEGKEEAAQPLRRERFSIGKLCEV